MADSAPAGDNPELFGERDPVFRPWPVARKGDASGIAEFVSRLKVQGIEFRSLSDATLQKQVEEEKANPPAEAKPKKPKTTATSNVLSRPKGEAEMVQRRDEIIVQLASAAHHGAIGLDLVSLLLSKDRPTQALQTLSNVRDKVGIGTLSAGRLANVAQAARALNVAIPTSGAEAAALGLDETTRTVVERAVLQKVESVGWQLLAMDRSSEALAAAQKRLSTQMRREQRYWTEMLGVHERGWCLSRVPGQRRVLRVKFGFSEAAPDLRAFGYAPMYRGKGKSVALDLSFLGPPAAVRLTLRKTDGTYGQSPVPLRLPSTAALEERILEARDTVFAKELWREVGREARLLVAHGVGYRENTLVFPVGVGLEGALTLETLRQKGKKDRADKTDATQGTRSVELDKLATTVCTALHLLLSNGHREHYRRRSQAGAASDRAGVALTYNMLRAVVANAKYEMAVKHVVATAAGLCAILHGVGETGSRFSLYERPVGAVMGRPRSASETLCASFLTQREFSVELCITADARVLVRSRTYVAPVRVQYMVQLLPGVAGANPLVDTYPPADTYSTVHDVVAYMQAATLHVVAMRALAVARAGEAGAGEAGAGDASSARAEAAPVWIVTADGLGIWKPENPFSRITFGMDAPDPEAVADDDEDEDDEDEDEDEYYVIGEVLPPVHVDSPLVEPLPFRVTVQASWPLGTSNTAVTRAWTWAAGAIPADESLQALVEGCVSATLKPEE